MSDMAAEAANSEHPELMAAEIDVSEKVEGAMAPVVVQAGELDASDWVASGNLLPGGQDFIVVTRSPNGSLMQSATYRSNASGTLTEVGGDAENAHVVAIVSPSSAKRKRSKEPRESATVEGIARRIRSRRWYKQRFCESWLYDERFKDWVDRVQNDVYKAYCKICNAELRCGSSELIKHMKTRYHQEMSSQNKDELRYIVSYEDLNSSQNMSIQFESEGSQEALVAVEHNVSNMSSEDAQDEGKIKDKRLLLREGMERVQSRPPGTNQIRSLPIEDDLWDKLASPPQIQKPAPNFRAKALVDGEPKDLRLTDFRGRFVLLVFYPNDFSETGSSLMHELLANLQEFAKAGCSLLAASTDSQVTHQAWVSTLPESGIPKIPFPLIADFNKRISRAFFVYDEETGCAFPSQFLIDPRGTVRHFAVNDFNLPISLEVSLRLLNIYRESAKKQSVKRVSQ